METQKTHDFEFPDEGLRFYFDVPPAKERLNHLTIRPSGTSNALRFHIQLHSPVCADNLFEMKKNLRHTADRIMEDTRKLLGAPKARNDETARAGEGGG